MTLGLFYLLKVKKKKKEREGKQPPHSALVEQFFLAFPPIFLVPQFFPKLTFSF